MGPDVDRAGIREGTDSSAGCKHQPLEGGSQGAREQSAPHGERHSTSFCFQMLRNGKNYPGLTSVYIKDGWEIHKGFSRQFPLLQSVTSMVLVEEVSATLLSLGGIQNLPSCLAAACKGLGLLL